MTNQTATVPKASELVFPAASPLCSLKQRVGITDIEVTYSRPGIKGRSIFGGLVPYGKLWRMGANQATKITLSTPVKLNGHAVPAGTYTLFSIPGKDEWTLIVNKELEHMGTTKYDEKTDLVRFTVKPHTLDHVVETLRIELEPVSDTAASLAISWEKTKLALKIEVDFIDALTERVEAVMSSDQAGKPFFQAAQLYLNHGRDMKKANEWIDAAIAERPIFAFYFFKAQILENLGDKSAALAAAKEAHALAIKVEQNAFAETIDAYIKKLS